MPSSQRRKGKRQKVRSGLLKQFLKGKTIVLDCGHRFTIHPFSNTMIMQNNGKTLCHS